MRNTKSTIAIISSLFLLISCQKDPSLVTTTSPVGNPIVIAPVAPPSAASDSTMLMGNPSSASLSVSDITNYLLKEIYYSVSYNSVAGIPNWVSWHLCSTDLGPVSRQNSFSSNNALPSGWYQVSNTSYTGSGFDRGHMCPSADRTTSLDANNATFLMTNIVPQAPRNNQITWASLENYCRDSLVGVQGRELYIIAGTYGEGGTSTSGGTPEISIDNGRVKVPAYVWKVIVVLSNGSNDLSRVGTNTRVISVIMPNNNDVATDWRTYRTSVNDIETLTSYDLLSNVSTSIQTTIEARVDNQ